MNFPKHWAFADYDGASEGPFACWGWSDLSLEDAEAVARQRSQGVMTRVLGGDRPESYLYGNKPVREEVLEKFYNEEGTLEAAITLNSYGCQILNTAKLMFVDVDLEDESSAIANISSSVGNWFGLSQKNPREEKEKAALERLHDLISSNPHFGVRAYRTKAGLRYLFTHAEYDPAADATQQLMSLLDTDPLYQRLCLAQQSFRARLNPKPWRCGMKALRASYPYVNQIEQNRIRRWQSRHQEASEPFASCEFIHHDGTTSSPPALAKLIKLHDQHTRATSGLELA